MYVQTIRLWVLALACLEALESRLARPQRASTMVEYGLIIALIAVVAMVAVKALGMTIAGLFTKITGQIAGV
ncbi:MAG TPA: Flp family type IVb pilin [Chloroflexota bacterium]|nr:Flp family type IVb pilin [Chloroflexota bacterium]